MTTSLDNIPRASEGAAAALKAHLGGLAPAEGAGRQEKRRHVRYSFPHMILLTPVAQDGATPLGAPLMAAGKHLSEGGIGFFHSQPLSDRKVIVTLDLPRGERLSFLLELRWCRFICSGWYESGGRFLRPTPTPEACQGKNPALKQDYRHPSAT